MSRTTAPSLLWKWVGCGALVVVIAGGVVVARRTGGSPTTAAATASATPAAGTGSMVAIPAGSFAMGTLAGDPDARPIRHPAMGAFEMDAREVTLREYLVCVGKHACSPPSTFHEMCNLRRPNAGNHPVNCVTFDEAAAYCRWAGKRLPTECEWEYAAHGKQVQEYPWGDQPPQGRACYNRLRGNQGTCPVGDHPTDRSPFGVLNLAGNVTEWTMTPYCYYDGTQCEDGAVATRGGSWDTNNPVFATVTYRDFVRKQERGHNLGFRCARGPVNACDSPPRNPASSSSRGG